MGWSQALLGGARKGWEAANNPKEMRGTKFIIMGALKQTRSSEGLWVLIDTPKGWTSPWAIC